MAIVRTLQMVDVFRGLDETQLNKIGEIAQFQTYDDGDVICEQGDPADKIFVLQAGQVRVVVYNREGDVIRELYLGEGQIIGEMTLVDEGRRSASVIASDEVTLYSIDNQALVTLCRENAIIGYQLMLNIAQDLSFKLRHRDADQSEKNN